jgi:hypothetical protein
MTRLVGAVSLALICLAVAGVALYAGFFAAGRAGQLTILDGKVSLQQGGSGSLAQGRTGDGLHAGDVVRTADGAHAVINFGNGSLARLDQGSELAIKGLAGDANGRSSLDQRRGQVWYEVAQGQSSSLQVAGGGARATTQEAATRFALLMDRAGVRGDVWQGSVTLQSGSETTRLQGDQSRQVPSSGPPARVAAIPATDRLDSFTVLNQALDTAHGGLLGTSSGMLQAHQTTEWVSLPAADGLTNLQVAIGWTAGQIQAVLQAPDGSSVGPFTTASRPASIEIPRAANGTWRLHLTAGDASTSWTAATSWRPAAPGEEEVAKAATHLNQVRESATSPAELDKLEGGSALKDDLARLDLANRFPDGSNPLAVHWVTRSALIDRAQVYVLRRGGPQPLAATFEQAHLGGTNGQPITMVTMFQKVGPTWKALFRSSAENDLQLTALAIDGDGYVTQASAAEQGQRYRLTSAAAGSALATYLSTGKLERLTPGESLRQGRPDFTGSSDGSAISGHLQPTRDGGVFSLPLQDGNLLVLAPLDIMVTETPPAGKCILQPGRPDASGSFKARTGLGRGTYGSLRLSAVFSYVAIVPSKANPQPELRLPGAWGQVVPEKTQAPCTTAEQPGKVEVGSYTEI